MQDKSPTSSRVKCKTLHVRDETKDRYYNTNPLFISLSRSRLLEPDSSMPADIGIVRPDPVLESPIRSMNYRTTARVVPAWRPSFVGLG